MSTPQSISGLASILSSEPLPTPPMFKTMDPARIANEMDKWVRDLYVYLKRLFGRFTATNIITTINQGGAFPRQIEKLLHYKGTNEFPFVTLDSGFDWRGSWLIYHIRTDAGATIYYPDWMNVPAPDGSIQTYYTSTLSGSYPLTLQTGPNQWSLRITSTGALEIGFDNGGLPLIEQRAHVFVTAIGSISATQSEIRLGNG